MCTDLRNCGISENEIEGYVNRYVKQIANRNKGFQRSQHVSRLGLLPEKPARRLDLDSLLDNYADDVLSDKRRIRGSAR